MARANPLLAGGVRPELDLMAEHKALMERFAAAAMAAQSAAAAAAAASAAKDLKEKEAAQASFTHKASASPSSSPKRDEPTQNAPIDLSNKRSSDEDDSATDEEMTSIHEKSFKRVKSDMNRNVVVHHNSSDEDADDDEELDVGENISR